MINKSIPFCKFAPENASALPRKLFVLLFCFLFIGVGNVWGADNTVTWTATSGSLGSGIGSGTITTGTFNWSYTRTLSSGESYTGWSSNCVQLGKNGGVENITFTTSNIPGTIKSVSVECASYSGAHKVGITVGGTTYLANTTATSSWTTVSTKSGTGTSSGTIVISFTGGSRALYIKSISVKYELVSASISLEDAGSGSIPSGTFYAGDSYTLPTTAASCTGKVLVGWSTVEIPTAGSKPASNYYDKGTSVTLASGTNTFYAVYANSSSTSTSKTFSFNITPDDFNTTSYDANNNEKTTTATATDASGATMNVNWTSSQIMKSGTAMQWQKSKGYIYNSTDLGTVNSVTVTSTVGSYTTYYGTSSQPSSGSSGSGKGYFKTSVGSATGTSSNVAINFTKSITVTTYSNYATSCCTPLGSINGSVSWSNAATAVVSWDNLDHVSSWTVKYKTHAAGAYTTWAGEQTVYTKSTTNDSRKVTITGLTPCTNYDFQIIANPASGYCDKDQTIEDSQTHNWTVTSTGVTHATASPAIPSTTCSGFSTTISPATGYALPADITVTNASKSWNSSTGALSISSVTGNVSITITPTCVPPVISGDPADASYYVGGSPDALSVSATLASGTLTYLWKVSTNGGSTWSDAAGTNNTASYSGASLSTASAGTLKFKCIVGNSEGGCTVESDVATITVSVAACSGFSFHYGNDGDDASLWTIACFGDAVSNVRTIEDFQIPSATHFYVGYQGTYTGGNSSSTTAPNSSTLTWSSLYFDASIGGGSRPMVGQATGATGTVKIIDNSDWTNKKASFIPDGYKLKFGSSDYSDFTQYSGHEYRSGLVEYSSNNTDDGVSVGIINANNSNSYVGTDNSVAMRHIFLNTGGTDYWSHDNATNFAIYDDTEGHKYFTCLMVKVPGEDYLYEGWVPTSCTDIIFCRMASSTLEWGDKNANVWNYVESQSLPSGKNLFTISAWSTGSWSAYAQKGQFRINEDWIDKNWYVRFVPSYVLSFDANGGEGAPDAQYVSVDAAPCQLTVSTTEPTRTGYTFLGWNESSSAASKDDDWDGGDTHDMEGDVTLYAVWAANHTLSYNYNGGDGSSCTGGTYYTGQSFTVCNNPGDKTGHTFTGWLGSNSTSYTAGSNYTMPNSDLTLTAQWNPETYTITYKDQGDVAYSGNATAGVPTGAPTTHTYGTSTALVDGVKSGYRFDGWFANSGCTGDAVISIGATAITANTTYYAKWTQVYTVTWSVNGDTWESGVVDGNTIVPTGTKVSELPTAPKKSDCDDAKVFMGWRASEIDGTSVSDPGGIFTTQAGSPTISANTTFYAVFADSNEGTATLTNDEISAAYCSGANAAGCGSQTSYGNGPYTISSAGGDWENAVCAINSSNIAMRVTNASDVLGRPRLISPDYGATVKRITINATNGSGTSRYIYICSSSSDSPDTQNIGSGTATNNTTTDVVIEPTSAVSSFYIYVNDPLTFNNITVEYGTPSNYVTSCSSCDADATFTNEAPAVSDIDCTGATLTMEGGLKTWGAEGCNISDYGFVIGTSDNPAIGGSGVTKYQVGTSNPTIGDDFSYEATDLTKGTRYYIRAYAINRHGTAYSSTQNFWTKNVSSIEITTAPTKTNYIVGETFDATGMVVTATMASGATEDVTSDVTYSDDALTAGTDKAFAINYSLCEMEKSVNQTINVYTLSVSEVTNPSYGEYSTSANVITVNPGSGKTYSLSVTNATAVDNMDGTYSIINPTSNVSVTINYRNATTVKVYYKVDGNTVITQDVTESTTATLPTASDILTALEANDMELPEGTIYTNLWGWSESEFTPQTEEPNIVSSPTIHASKTFYAVYTNMYKKQILPRNFSGTYSENDGEKTYDGVGYHVSNICKQSEKIQFRSSPGYLYSTSTLQYINKIEITGLDLIVNACSDNEGTLDGDAITPTGSDKYVYTFPANKQYFKIKGKGGTDQVSRIDIYYATATPKFMTTFCDDKIGAPTVTDTKVHSSASQATVTLSWDAVANATGYKVKWGSISNDWEDVGTERTYVKENVSTGTVKWFVKAKYDVEDYCGAEITKGSTTVNTAYELVYDANTTGYTGDEPDGGFYESGETITVSATELSKSRFHWNGWTPYNTSTSAAISVTTGTFTMPAADVLVQGSWTEVLSGDEIYVTSAKDKLTMSSMDIIAERTTFKSGTMTISDETGGQGGTFHAVIDGATADASDGLLANVKIEYTPSKANVTESATMTAVIGSESYDFTVYGRSLPADFVIVAKVGAAWTALPADATSAGLQQGYSLTLDNTTTPTKATLAPSSAIFNYYAKSAKTTDYIRLAGKDNSKALWGNATNNIKMNAAIGGGYATGDAYEWKLATTDNATYTLYNDNSSRYLGVNSDKKWGTHSTGNTASKVLFFLPVDDTADNIAMTVSSWGDASFTFTTSDDIPDYDHVVVECNGDTYSATMTGSGPYTITISEMDFEDYSGASLVVQWLDDKDVVLAQGAVLMPIFITGDNTDFGGYDPDILSSTDVHVVNGSTLTITTSGLRVHDLSIEGGSTLNISTTGGGGAVTFGMNSLYLRGGWNDDYTEYDMPRVYIDPKSTLTKTVNTVNFDISVDSRNYYPFAVPFPVTVSAVDYANATLAGASQYGKHYVIKEYDGDARAKNGPADANWKIVEDGTEYGTSSATLQPGKGYILTAVSIPAYGGGVIRFPMSFTNDWTAKGEQATVSEKTKNVFTVTAHEGTATTGGGANNRHKGWNMLGVPFMSCYTSGTDMYTGEGSADLMTGRMELSGDPADPYAWESGEVVYVSVPTHDFSEYIQTDITTAKLVPGWSFFIQVGETGNLTFLTTKQREDSDMPIYAPRREAEKSPVVKTGVVLSDGEKSDKTTLLISDKYSSEYEIGADLEKMFGNAFTLSTYTITNGTNLAFNALSTAEAAQAIPVGVRIPTDGEYTFSLNSRYADANIERLDLIDYQTGDVTNLMQNDYTFTATQGQNEGRFALNVTKAKPVATDVETVSGEGLQSTDVRKMIIEDKLYIIRDGRMYDATGKRVNGN